MKQASSETRSVVVEREFTFPPEKVWRAITQPHLIDEWLMKSDFEPVVGRRFTLRRTPKPDVHIIIDCQVLAVEPNRALSYRWDAMGLESIVTWTLTPTSAGTRLRMEQSGFRRDQKQAFGGAMAGWRNLFENLEQVLARMA